HRFDYDTPIEETTQALHVIVKAIHVRYISMSPCWPYQYHAINQNITPFVSVQNHHSSLYRDEEREMFPTLKHFDADSIPWSPLGRELLARHIDGKTLRLKTDGYIPSRLSWRTDELTALLCRVEELAEKGVSMTQISTAWIMNKPGITAPIIGTTSPRNLADILGALEVTFTEAEMKDLEEPYQTLKVLGHALCFDVNFHNCDVGGRRPRRKCCK
ncbi:NADP-dependent oxidoreductase domain-containing protein, partial [Dichomitus squalens]